MFSKNNCLKNKSLFWIVMSGLILLLSFVISDSYSARAKEEQLIEKNELVKSPTNNSLIDFSVWKGIIPTKIQDAIVQKIFVNERIRLLDETFEVSAFDFSDDKKWARVVVVPKRVFDSGWEEFSESDIVELLLHENELDNWDVFLFGTSELLEIKDSVPSSFIEFPASLQVSQNEYRFPWTYGHSWWKNGGWHPGGYGGLNNAIDFQPQSNDDIVILAASDGVLNTLCDRPDDSVQVWLKITNGDGTSGYGHMNKNSINRSLLGQSVSRGTNIGKINNPGYRVYFETPCGYGTGTHLHFLFPTTDITMFDLTSNRAIPANEMGVDTGTGNVFYTSNNQTGTPTCDATSVPSNYTKCADENGHCSFSGMKTIYYGANSCYRVRNYSDGVDCTNNNFLPDPAVNWVKACFIDGGGSQTGSWRAEYYDTTDRWWDNNNSNNHNCGEDISGPTLDKNYGTSGPCGMDGDYWIGDYSATINFPAGNYVFVLEHDDGMKLWLNGSNIAERGESSSGNDYVCGARYLNGNANLRAMLREDGGDARIKVQWTTDTSVCNPPGSFWKSGPSNGSTGQPNNLTLSWSESSGAISYSFCYDTSNNNNCDTSWQSAGMATSVVIYELTPSTTYYWQVQAKNKITETYADGNSWWSFTTKAAGLDCSQISYTGVILYENTNCNRDLDGKTKSFNQPTSWTDIVSDFNDITSSVFVTPGWSVKVHAAATWDYYFGAYGGPWRCIKGTIADLSIIHYTYIDTSLIINDNISSIQVFNNNSCTIISSPSNLQASDGLFITKVQLDWNASAGATSYNIYRAPAVNAVKTLLGSTTGLTFNDSSAVPGIIYYYWVKACQSTGCSVASIYNTGWRMLTAPANFQASDGTYTGKVQLTWTVSSGATSYKVFRATTSWGTRTLLGSPLGIGFGDTTATPGVTYYYWVKACKQTRCSVFSLVNTGWRKPQ